jgi:acetolactate synthase I/II/III large subunit
LELDLSPAPFDMTQPSSWCSSTTRNTVRSGCNQEREFPGRLVATQLRNPDFAAYAEAFGGFGVHVDDTEQFATAFEEALASNSL